jgi:hypothetical protein
MDPEIREVAGFPLFGVSRDYRAFSRRKGDWHQLRLSRRSLKGGSPIVILWRESDGTTHARSLAGLVADAFDTPPPPPPLPPRGEGRERTAGRFEDDEDIIPIEEALAWAPIRPRPVAPHPGGLLMLGPAARGTTHGRRKLDVDKVREIRRLRREGWSTGALARRFGVSRALVCYVLAGRIWRHVPDCDDRPLAPPEAQP